MRRQRWQEPRHARPTTNALRTVCGSLRLFGLTKRKTWEWQPPTLCK